MEIEHVKSLLESARAHTAECRAEVDQAPNRERYIAAVASTQHAALIEANLEELLGILEENDQAR